MSSARPLNLNKSKMALAKRCDLLLLDSHDTDFVKAVARMAENQYDPEKNPKGVINFCGAENMLTENMLNLKIGNGEIYLVDDPLYRYFSAPESIRLRKAMANFINCFFRTEKPVLPENLFFGAAALACLDQLIYCLADPGDCFLMTTPMFPQLQSFLKVSSQIKPILVHLTEEMKDNENLSFELTVGRIEQAFVQAKAEGKNVKGLLMVNPGNPVGDVLSPKLLIDILHFCHRNSLHFVSDEVYALSVHDKDTEFTSVLSLPDLPDPDRTHLVYGLSKDFGLVKYRLGVIHTVNPALNKCLTRLRFLNFIPMPIMTACSRLLEDLQWCERVINFSRKGMAKNAAYASERLQKIGLLVRHAPASFYVWASFKEVCGPMTFRREKALVEVLFDHAKLHICGGSCYFCEDPGWFRFNIAIPSEYLEIALERLETVVTLLRNSSTLDDMED